MFARRASNGGLPTWIWARRRDRTPLLNPSSIVCLDTQKKNKCYDSKNNVVRILIEKPIIPSVQNARLMRANPTKVNH